MKKDSNLYSDLRKILMKRLNKKSIGNCYPEKAKLWHPTKNGNLTPYDVTHGSGKIIWWKCSIADDHEWQARPYSVCKSKKTGCPFCAGLKAAPSNCLTTTYPEIARQWHPIKNGTLTPDDVTSGSAKKVWWKCEEADDHEWQTQICARTVQQQGCPYCSGRKAALNNCLATTYPKLAQEWHPSKNGKLTPFDVTHGSKQKIWWKCKVSEDHIWLVNINSRTSQHLGCPVCSNKKVSKSNCLAVTHPDLAKEWHPTKNGKLTPCDFVPGSHTKVWWKCDVAGDHEWRAKITKRAVSNRGCPCCSGHKIVESNCLATTHPEIAKQWHKTKNGNLTPQMVIAGSRKKIWWQCNIAEDHEWEVYISARTYLDTGCPCCAGYKIVESNCLATTYPELIEEWDFNRNGNLSPQDIGPGTKIEVHWICRHNKKHKWPASVSNRTWRNSGCPYCSNRISKESIKLFELVRKEFPSLISESCDLKNQLRINGWSGKFDAFIPEYRLFLEYDGSYYHNNTKTKDLFKTELAIKNDFNIVRIRQEPLNKITENDVVVPNKYNEHVYAAIVVEKILKLS